MSLLGLDVGTTGTKAVAFTPEGKIIGSAYKEYPLHHPQPGWAELDPMEVWSAVEEVLRRVSELTKADPVRSIAVCSQGEAGVPIDEDGRGLYASMISFDTRCVEEVKELEKAISTEKLFHLTGHTPHTTYTVPKLMWLKAHEPDAFSRLWKYLCWEDYCSYRLGGCTSIDWSLAGRTLAFDVRKKEWADDVLDAAGLPHDMFADPVPAGTAIGKVSKSAAESLGLPEGALLVAGAHDQPAGALGSGVIRARIAMDATGTVECITAALAEPVTTPEMMKWGFCSYPHAKSDLYVTLAYNFTGGSLLRWYRDTFGREEVREAAESDRDPYELILEGAAAEPTRLLVLPHFTSTATPYFDSFAKGAILGLSLTTKRSEIVRALLEGVTFEMKLNVELLDECGVKIDELRPIGGGAKSRFWMQLKADIFNRPVIALDVTEAACLGMAMLGGVACGEFASLEEAVEATVKPRETFEPDGARSSFYEERFQLYKELYPAVKDLAHRM